MKLLSLVVTLAFLALSSPAASEMPMSSVPVVVELFTSEGCSSCPPADALLRQLDRQPVPGAQLIVLSEHVDYWNHIGWKDPYSAAFFSERQGMYAQRFNIGSVYTPEMVVDGSAEFVGSDGARAKQAIAKAQSAEKLPVRISNASTDNLGTVKARVEIGALTETLHAQSGDVLAVLALNRAESQVLRGENEGRRLQHVAVARNLAKVGAVSRKTSFAQDISLKTEPGAKAADLRLIVFVQDPSSGRILGAALQLLR